MTDRRSGTTCSLTYDPGSRRVVDGDVIVTPAGSAYLVLDVHAMRSKHAGRLRLDCVRIDAGSIGDDDVVHPLYWYKRQRRSA